MPSVIYENTVSGAGSAILGGTRVLYVAAEVTTLGPAVHAPNEWDLSTLLGVGHWELGNDLTAGGLISGVGWNEPHWIYALIIQWIAPPGLVGADLSYAIQQYIRWTLTAGTEVHFVVFGDT